MEFEKLVLRPGYEEIAAIGQEWQRVASRQKGKENKVPLPNYYLIADDGFDFEELFEAMAGYLEAQELMAFESETRVYSFFLKYSSPNEPNFTSFQMLYDAVEHELNRFSHPYDGILVVDITEWVEKPGAVSEKKFIDFLSYMDTIDDRTMAIFLDRSGNDEPSRKAFDSLDLAMRIQLLHMSYKDVDAGLKELEDNLAFYGFSLEEGFRKKMRETVEMVLHTPGSEGIESIRQLALDMGYCALKAEKEVGLVLNEENSASFLPGGEWTRIFQNKKKTRRLGLVGEED
ncbi:MAG: hypothetical protein K6E59_02660 [Bacilli bacterium]|nr:hypothetical protein [Bacilli bacterium]